MRRKKESRQEGMLSADWAKQYYYKWLHFKYLKQLGIVLREKVIFLKLLITHLFSINFKIFIYVKLLFYVVYIYNVYKTWSPRSIFQTCFHKMIIPWMPNEKRAVVKCSHERLKVLNILPFIKLTLCKSHAKSLKDNEITRLSKTIQCHRHD